ncbi:LOW QUALITY PROTEIN: hypothetical protein HID58_091226 [Brassica napus]|uniref:Epithiospecifier protein n=1 Tax=Brassica napus TaxID=3708 RepID=A0ABQ7X5X4_BRANA|nr:LOW QUALITY PROTEIN: hypothetical protein HID58_091226 [Brassica napus]
MDIEAVTPTLQGEWIKVEQKGGEGPGPRSSHGIAVVGDKLYSFGGELTPNISIDKDLYVFDFKTHTWSIETGSGDLPNVKALGTRMVPVGTKLYIFGGRDEHKQFDDFYSYDTVKKEWKFLTKLDEVGGPRLVLSIPWLGMITTCMYSVGKGGANKTPVRFGTIEAYNIAEGKWIQLPDPGEQLARFEKRGGAGFLVVQGKIWVVYGFATSPDPNGKNDYESDHVQFYDPVTQNGPKWRLEERNLLRGACLRMQLSENIYLYLETWPDPRAHLGPGTLSDEGYALDTETLVWERFGGGDEPSTRGWSAYTTATVYGKKGLLMHGGKLPTNNRTDELYFYAVNSA